MRLFTAWLLALLALAAAPAWAALPPRPDGPVLDQANIIPDDQEAALDARLRQYNGTTGRAVIVATVASLDDLPVEDYAQQLAETWDIGGAETEEGVLLLVAPSERKLRIHAARGVQERLTDALAGRIIRDVITPRFKAGDFGGGITEGVNQIVAQLDRSPADARAVAEAAAAAGQQDRAGDGGGFGSVIFWIVLIVFFMMIYGRRGRRGRRHGFSTGGLGPIILLDALSHMGGRGGGGGGFGGGGFGGFGGGGGGFDGGGASGSW